MTNDLSMLHCRIDTSEEFLAVTKSALPSTKTVPFESWRLGEYSDVLFIEVAGRNWGLACENRNTEVSVFNLHHLYNSNTDTWRVMRSSG